MISIIMNFDLCPAEFKRSQFIYLIIKRNYYSYYYYIVHKLNCLLQKKLEKSNLLNLCLGLEFD